MAAHYRGRQQRCYTLAVNHVRRALRFATLSRKLKPKDDSELYRARLEAACEEHGFKYDFFRESLTRSNILLNKKILADLAIWEPRSFKCLTDFAWNKAKSEGLNGINDLGDPPKGVILKPMVKTVQTNSFSKKAFTYSFLAFGMTKCEGLIGMEQWKPENLAHEHCIKQACLLSVNSASTLLTTTASAFLDICKIYKESLNSILSLMEQIQTQEGEHPELWEAVVESRMKVNKAKATLVELTSYMETVEKVVNSTSEAAFNVGADYMCTALCERLYSAQKEINNQIEILKKLEEEYVKLQHDIAKKKEKDNIKKLEEVDTHYDILLP